MDHPDYWPLIEAHADGDLVGEELIRLQAHLADCADCTRRLAGAKLESLALQRALAAPVPPESVMQGVMAGIGTRARPRARARYGAMAGVAANLLTAALLLALSLGSGAPWGEMLLVALGVALIWGAFKGLVYVQVLPLLPRAVLWRALVFGIGTWILLMLLLAMSSLSGATSDLSIPFLVIGSLVHSLVYALLLSWIHEWLRGGRPPGPLLNPATRVGGTTVLFLAMVLAGANAAYAHSSLQTVPTATDTPAPTGTATPGTATPIGTATPTPTMSLATPTVAATTPTPGATPSAAVTPAATARPSPHPTVRPTAQARKSRRSGPSRSAREQVRSILPSVVSPPGRRSTVQRIHDVIVLLNFL